MVGLMDCNNFFVSCERLFRPDLLRKPVAVLSSNDGCIVARSQEVKDIGVPMGAPLFHVKDMVEKYGITLFSSNFPLYRDISRRVMNALREEFGHISIYSIDEAFFDVLYPLNDIELHKVRARIMKKTGIPVSFGVAQTKTIAKLANGVAKKGDGIFFAHESYCRDAGSTIPVGTVWGIGREIAAKLNKDGIYTVAELLARGLSYARSSGGVVGERLYFELSGIPAESQEDGVEGSVTSTRSFPSVITDPDLLRSALAYHVTHVAEKLRERDHLARRISIFCMPGRGSGMHLDQGSRSIVLGEYTARTDVLLKAMTTLFEEVYAVGIPYKKAGVSVSDIVPEAYVTGSLLEVHTQEKSTQLDQVIDLLNHRFGRGSVRTGLIGREHLWRERCAKRSHAYTTSWSELASVRAI